jgi:hypothetical protein
MNLIQRLSSLISSIGSDIKNLSTNKLDKGDYVGTAQDLKDDIDNIQIPASLELGETSSTAYRGDKGKIAYDHSQVTHDKTLVGLGSVDNTSDLNKPISNATQTALGLKLSIESQSTTGTLVSFLVDKVYGTLTTPETGNITADITNAKLGVTNIIIHNSGTAPTFGSQFKKLSGSGNYVTGVVNYIYCTFITTTEVIYSINQRT